MTLLYMSLNQIIVKLCKYYYKPVDPAIVKSWAARNNASVNDVISKFFRDPHTFYDNSSPAEFLKRAPRPKVGVSRSDSTVTLELGTFLGLFKDHAKSYIEKCQMIIKQAILNKTRVVIDLRNNFGGDDRIMRRAIAGIELCIPGTVLVSRNTTSAAEMIAADLIYDNKWSRRGPRTAGALSHCKNITLPDGAFLGVTQGAYTTPKGHLCDKFYL